MQDRSTYNWRTLVVGAMGLAFGMFLVVIAEDVNRDEHSLVRGLLEAMAISLITGGLLGLAYEFFLRRELIRHFDNSVTAVTGEVTTVRSLIDQRMGLSTNLDDIGLVEVCPKEGAHNYSDMIVRSKRLFFAFNDGRTWFSNHEHDLYIRSQIKGLETYILLLRPSSPFIDALSEKVSQSTSELRQKIDETIRLLSRLNWQGKIEIYGHSMPTSYSLIMNEDRAVFIPYHMARKVDKVPCFVFSSSNGDGFYASLWRDVDTLINHQLTTRLYPPSIV